MMSRHLIIMMMLACSFYYNNDKEVIALEFHSPANVAFRGTRLFELEAQQAYSLMRDLDENIEVDGDGLTSLDLGVGFYAPYYAENPAHPIESVIAFKKEYYEN